MLEGRALKEVLGVQSFDQLCNSSLLWSTQFTAAGSFIRPFWQDSAVPSLNQTIILSPTYRFQPIVFPVTNLSALCMQQCHNISHIVLQDLITNLRGLTVSNAAGLLSSCNLTESRMTDQACGPNLVTVNSFYEAAGGSFPGKL